MPSIQARAEAPVSVSAESPRELTRTGETWILGLRHWIDPLDADREGALERVYALEPVAEELCAAEEVLKREEHRAPENVADRLREREAGAKAQFRTDLTELYAAGLALREGRTIALTPLGDLGWDLFMVRWFFALGVDEPAGIAWCATCGFVFRPARKSHAYKCDRCHHHPPPAPMAPEATADGGWTYALPTEKGWGLVRYTPCRECGVPFRAKRADARRCPDRMECRQRAAVPRENIELGFVQS